MSGRKSKSGMGTGSTVSYQRISGGSKSGSFTQTSQGKWESEKLVIAAAGLVGKERQLVSIKEPQFVILEGTKKGKIVYRAYEQLLGRKKFLHTSETVEDAVKKINK